MTHNVYLQQLAETGVVGLALLLAIIAACLRSGRACGPALGRAGDARARPLARSSLVAMIGFLTASLFISDSTDKRLWILLALGPTLLDCRASSGRRRRRGSRRSRGPKRSAHPPCPAVGGELGLEARAGRGSGPPAEAASSSSGARAAANDGAVDGGAATSVPVTPSSTSSPIPPMSVATTGTEHAIASITAVGSASERDGLHSTSTASSIAMTSGR